MAQNAQTRGRKPEESNIRVLMCCSDLETVKGGMVTVVKNYLSSSLWKRSSWNYVPTHTEGGKVKKTLYFAGAYFRIVGLALMKKIDIAHLHMAERGSFFRKAYLTRTLKMLGIPVVIHHHGAEFEDFYQALPKKKKEYVRRILEMADCNLVLSTFLKEQMLEKAPGARVEVLHNAVDVPQQRPYCPQGTRIIMLGRQGKRKGSYDLLEAMAAIKDQLPEDTQLWMCGDGEVEEVRQRAKELGIEDLLSYTGWIAGEDRERCVEGAMIHVLPSYREALPMSILETMARGIPNISTSIASIPEVIIDGETGYMIKPGDIEALKTCILRLTHETALREKMSRSAYELIRGEFSLEICVDRLEALYEELREKRQ